MKKLLELVQVINKHKVKVVEVIGSLPPRKTMVQEFYDKVSDGTLTDDISAAQHFYGTGPDDRNYKELKKRLTKRLQNTALFIDIQQARYDELGKAFYTCWKEFAIAKTLNAKGATLNANTLLEKILKQSIRYEFIELILNTCRLLRINYGTVRFDKKKFYYYNELFNKYTKIYQADTLAEEYYATMLVEFHWAKKRDNAGLREQAQVYIDELSGLVEQYDSYRLNLCYRLIRLMAAKSQDDHDLSIDICQEAMGFFQAKPKYPSTAQGIFMRQLFLLYWQQRRYEEGEELLKRAVEVTTEGNVGWFSNYGLLLLLCFHSKKYDRAWEILHFVMQHPRFKGLSEQLKERWRIYRAYLYYLVGIGEVEGVEMKKFRLNKFLNEVPTFSVDKRSRNIPILIIQILFLILYKRYNEAIDRMEAINQYCNRHLKKDDTFRSNCFIKMLLKIIEAGFHRAGAERKAAKLRAKLESVPLEVASQVYETEIIPYEDLWDMALHSLENKFWSSGRK
jgi:hypothetical protein